jgi:hypothetical protein
MADHPASFAITYFVDVENFNQVSRAEADFALLSDVETGLTLVEMLF